MKRLSLTAWIFIGMAAGVALGVFAPGFAKQLGPVSSVFLRLIRSIIAPLIFATLVSGVAGGGDMKQMGRIGVKAILYFEIVTTLALFLGLAAVNLVRPGLGVPIQRTSAEAALTQARRPRSPPCWSTSFRPASSTPWRATTCCRWWSSRFCSARPARPSGRRPQPVVAFCDSLAEVMFRYTNYVMYLAPLGVGAAIAVTVGSKGMGVLFGLGKLILTMYAALVDLHRVGAGRRRDRCSASRSGRFYRAVREPFLIAFSTASSEAALPLALENMEALRRARNTSWVS